MNLCQTTDLSPGGDVLLFPLAASINFSTATLRDLIGIRSPVNLALLNQSLLLRSDDEFASAVMALAGRLWFGIDTKGFI